MESYKRIAKWYEHEIASPEEMKAKEDHEAKIAALEAKIKSIETAEKAVAAGATANVVEERCEVESDENLEELKASLKSLQESIPELPTTMGVTDGDPENARVHVRGSHLSLGQEVDRRTPVVLSSKESEFGECEQSGRLQLANWIANETNPLTARVWANRIWRWHFGEGLVATENNFGLLGERPVNPPLLDWLTIQLIESGWSTKALHRIIMLSKTYQQTSDHHADNVAIDPENRFLWRFNLQRMDAEVFRDSLLAVSGQLDREMGGSQLHVKNREFIFNHTSKDETSYASRQRSVYLPVIRNNLYDGFSLFDYTDASVPVGDRSSSVVAPQALYALNSDLVLETAEHLARNLIAQFPDSIDHRVRELYVLTLGREPSDKEVEILSSRLDSIRRSLVEPSQNDDQEIEVWTVIAQAILISNEFIYVR